MNLPDGPLRPDQSLHGDLARLSLLGHDLRAAVSDIIGGLRLIDHSAMDHGTGLQLERVRTAGEVLARLLEEAFSAMGAEPDISAPANVQMTRFLYDVEMRWSGRARENGLAFHVAVAPDLPKVLALDRIALERVLANILSNAIKYTDAGTVRLDVTLSDTGSIRMEVRDEGPGFSQDALERLYQYAGRPDNCCKPGHGLGLHISKDMAGRLGGTLEVANLPDGGAAVAIVLPPDCWSAPHPETTSPLPDLSRLKVLVAEDNATNQALIGHMLSAMGAEFEIAADGVEALHWLEREDFDLLLIDIEMPRLSGIDVIRSLRGKSCLHARMPIIAATAYVLRSNRDAIYAAGADAILAKPLPNIATFGQAIASVMARNTDDRAGGCAVAGSSDEKVELNRATFEHLLGIAGPDGTKELLDRVHSDLRRAERGLIAGLTETDFAAIRADTHVLISLAGAVGAERLQCLAEAMNAAAHSRDASGDLARLGPLALSDLDRLIDVVARERGRRGDRQ